VVLSPFNAFAQFTRFNEPWKNPNVFIAALGVLRSRDRQWSRDEIDTRVSIHARQWRPNRFIFSKRINRDATFGFFHGSLNSGDWAKALKVTTPQR